MSIPGGVSPFSSPLVRDCRGQGVIVTKPFGGIKCFERLRVASDDANPCFDSIGRCAKFRVCLNFAPGTAIVRTQARSSGGERYLDTVEVGGSKPPAPTRPRDVRAAVARPAFSSRQAGGCGRGTDRPCPRPVAAIRVTLPDGSVREVAAGHDAPRDRPGRSVRAAGQGAGRGAGRRRALSI